MLRHKQFSSRAGKGGSARYYTEHLATSEYYAKGVGLLQGRTFDHLGLSKREVDLSVFSALEQNVNPETGERITLRTNDTRKEWRINSKTGENELHLVDNRRPGMDLPFVVPKTVSEVMWENPGEFADAIERVCILAADKAMGLAENLAMVRVRKGGLNEDRSTGNLLYLRVIHRDARPVGSNIPDPYWHAHHFIFNMTWDPVEKCMKAVQLHDVLKHADTIDAYFLSEIERGLTELGIGIERTPDGRSFEVTSVKGKDIFSKRRNEILKAEFKDRARIEVLVKREISAAKRLGKTLDYDKVKHEIRNRLGKALAQRKVHVSMEEQLAALRAQMTPEIRASLQQDAVLAGERRNWLSPSQAKEEVVFSVFKKKSVVHELDIVNHLLRATGGAMRFEQALEFARGPAFINLDNEGHVTTEAVRAEERQLLADVRAGQDKHIPIAPAHEIRNPRVAAAPDQAKAVKFILRSRDAIMDVSGIAGSGKTTLLKEVVPAMRAQGSNVILLAPTSASELNLQQDFPGAITLQKFQSDPDVQRSVTSKSVIILDEVSMVSIPQLAHLAALIKEKQARLVTLGDTDQHHSVERGDAIRILQESGAVRSVELTETYRAQVQYLKDTVLDLKAGRQEEGYARLDEHGDIREVQDLDELRQQAVETHLDAVRVGHLAILASPIHSEARQVASIVRDTLKAEGKIGAEDHALRRLTRIDVEGVELRDPLHYQQGRVVVFHTKTKGGFKTGQKWQVRECIQAGRVILEREGKTRTFNPNAKGKWNIYEPFEIVLSVGDQVRITEGFRERGVTFRNNDIARIAAIDSERVTLDDGRSMRKDFLHLDQGVCITSHASECRTVRQIVALAPLESFAQMDAKAFYVLASRATHRALFFTDCKDAFRDAVLRPGEREAVWDYERAATGSQERAKLDLQPGKRLSPLALTLAELAWNAHSRGEDRSYEKQQQERSRAEYER
jgi:conjugative relaxase-like TrwC/TraI family protein